MSDEKNTLEKIEHVPSEFADFVREAGIRAFDALANRLLSKQTESPTRLQALADTWTGLDHDEKRDFFGQVIAAASILGAAAPMLTQMATKRKQSPKKKPAAKKSARATSKTESAATSRSPKAAKEASPSPQEDKPKKEKKERKEKKDRKSKKEKKDKKDKKSK
jgi:outer membrane biosynthesis protein TonB